MLNNLSRVAKLPILAGITLLLIGAFVVTMTGASLPADCDDDCTEEAGNCCECVCCPTKVVMSFSEEYKSQAAIQNFEFTIDLISLSDEQVWYGSIDHPPQNQS
jgi:hypothetical protein